MIIILLLIQFWSDKSGVIIIVLNVTINYSDILYEIT